MEKTGHLRVSIQWIDACTLRLTSQTHLQNPALEQMPLRPESLKMLLAQRC